MKNIGTILIIQLIILSIVGIGWIKNIIKLASCDFQTPYQCEIIHAVGLIPPVGMITGWMDLGK